MDLYYYDSTTKTRKVVPIEAQVSNFKGATPTKNGTAGLVIAPSIDDRDKFLSGSGVWADPPVYLSQSQAEDLFVSVSDTLSAETSVYATEAGVARSLKESHQIMIYDDRKHSAASTLFNGSSDVSITLPSAMFTDVTVEAALRADTADNCTGNASTADQLKSKINITITDSKGNPGSVTVTDFSTDVVLKMPEITVTGGGEASTGTYVLRITDGENYGDAVELDKASDENVIPLPEIINANISGVADQATQLEAPVEIIIKSGNNESDPGYLQGDGETVELNLPDTIAAFLDGTAMYAEKAIKDNKGRTIDTTYALANNATLSGTPIAVTPAVNDNSRRIATTAYVRSYVSQSMGVSYAGQGDSSLSVIQISSSLNNDPHFADTVSTTYLQRTTLLDSIKNVGSVTSNRMFYTTSTNRVGITPITSVGRDLLSKSSATDVREAIGAITSSATVAKANTLATARTIRIKDSANNKGDPVSFNGSVNIELPLPSNIKVSLDSNTVVPSAQKLAAPVSFSINNRAAGNKGGTTSFDGSTDVILNLPATISSALNGNAATASKLKQAVSISITDGTNTGTASSFDGSSNLSLQLPTKLNTALSGNADSATVLKTPRTFQIKDSSNHTGTAQSFSGAANVALPLPSTITAEIDGNAKTATTLKTARTLKVDLTKTDTASFNGSANATMGVSGVLPVVSGGTGKTDLSDVTVGTAEKLKKTYNVEGISVPYDDELMNLSIQLYHYGYCETPSDTPLKEILIRNFKPVTSGNPSKGFYSRRGTRIHVHFKYGSTCGDTSDVKLQVKDQNGNQAIALPMYGPDGKRMYSFPAGLYTFIASSLDGSNYAWYCSRVPGIEKAASADQATKDGSGNVITSTYATKSAALGSLSIGTGTNAGKLGYSTLNNVTKYIDLPVSNNVQQTKLTTGTYPILTTANQNQTTNLTGITNFSTDFKIDVTNKTLTAPVIKATSALILPTTSSTMLGAIWLED